MKDKFYVWMMLGAIIVAGAMTGCNKGDDEDGNKNGDLDGNKITAVVENGSTYTTVSKVWGMMQDNTSSPSQRANVVTADYVNGGFVVELPATVHSKYLEALGNEALGNGITISNPKVTTGTINFYGYKQDSEALTGSSVVGNFIHCNYSPNSASKLTSRQYSMYLYADGDVSITGTSTSKGSNEWTRIDNYDHLSLKKGWNVIYILDTSDESTKTETSTYSHTAPEGLKWQFVPLR